MTLILSSPRLCSVRHLINNNKRPLALPLLQRSFSVLDLPREELKDIREHLRAFAGSPDKSEINSVTMQDAASALHTASTRTTPHNNNNHNNLKNPQQLDPGVATVVTLNNPKARNALTGKMMVSSLEF